MGSTFADSDFGDTVETQLTLGTGSLLGIFFGLVMVCGIFFGFGYSLGRRSSSSSAMAAATPPARVMPAISPTQIRPGVPSPLDQNQPVPDQPVAATVQSTVQQATAQQLTPQPISTPESARPVPLPNAATTSAVAASKGLSTTLATAAPKVASPPAAAPATTQLAANSATAAQRAATVERLRIPKPSAIQPVLEQPNARIPLVREVRGPQFTAQNLPSPYFVWTPPFDVHYKRGFPHRVIAQTPRPAQNVATAGAAEPRALAPRSVLPHALASGPAMVVQVAALSREDDAEVLASSLRERGYAPSIKNGAADTLYHVEVGPFSRDVAFATRQRLIAKGYSAVLK